MTAAAVRKAQSRSYVPKNSTEARKLDRINATLAWQEYIAWHCAGKTRLQGYVRITALIYLKDVNGDLPYDRGDLDNYLKAIVDGLQYGGLFAPRPGCKKGNDKAVIRYGTGTGIYPATGEEEVRLILEEIDL